MPHARTLLVGKPLTAGQVLPAAGVTLYTEGRFPRARRTDSEVSWAEAWLGAGDYTLDDARHVWNVAEQVLQACWRDGSVRLYGTPSTTGRDLLLRTMDHTLWAPMDLDHQQLVRSTAGQGRMETFSEPGGMVCDVWEYDARMAYAALTHQMPVGEPQLLDGHAACRDWQQAHPYGEGRYQVSWKAPDDYRHPGILPAHCDDGVRDWQWPLESPEPSWCGAAELFTAIRAGYHIQLHQAVVWTSSGDPLRTWTDRLLRCLHDITDQLPARAHQRMGRALIRAILLHTIGALHGAPRKVNSSGTHPPTEAQGVRLLGDKSWAWYTLEPPAWPELVHPEWSATIWSRARARLASSHRGAAGFLTIDPAQLLGLRTDAIYTTAATGWEAADKGQPGQWVLKGHHQGLWERPASGNELLAMVGR